MRHLSLGLLTLSPHAPLACSAVSRKDMGTPRINEAERSSTDADTSGTSRDRRKAMLGWNMRNFVGLRRNTVWGKRLKSAQTTSAITAEHLTVTIARSTPVPKVHGPSCGGCGEAVPHVTHTCSCRCSSLATLVRETHSSLPDRLFNKRRCPVSRGLLALLCKL